MSWEHKKRYLRVIQCTSQGTGGGLDNTHATTASLYTVNLKVIWASPKQNMTSVVTINKGKNDVRICFKLHFVCKDKSPAPSLFALHKSLSDGSSCRSNLYMCVAYKSCSFNPTSSFYPVCVWACVFVCVCVSLTASHLHFPWWSLKTLKATRPRKKHQWITWGESLWF